MSESIDKKLRMELLAKLEDLVGQNFYNGSIQNWGPNGRYEGEGRGFRYPLTMQGDDGVKFKRKHPDASDLAPEIIATGHYVMGANKLHIIRALDDVLKFLEDNNSLKL